MIEYLDVVDENGIPTGETVERSVAHREGFPHRTSHLWLVRRREDRIQVLLQKRAMTKSFPGVPLPQSKNLQQILHHECFMPCGFDGTGRIQKQNAPDPGMIGRLHVKAAVPDIERGSG